MENKELSSQTRKVMKYHKKNIKRMSFDFNINTELEIIEKLDSVPSKATYIKKLIREDIKNSKKI